MTMGQRLTYGAVYAALACYFAACAICTAVPSDAGWRRAARLLWTWGCALIWLHIGLAFDAFHHCSHAEALAATARDTRLRVGFEFAEGLYFNYVFAVLWTADSFWWWVRPESYDRRRRAVTVSVHAFLLLIIVSATVLFEDGLVRWISLAAVALLALLLVRRRSAHNRTILPA